MTFGWTRGARIAVVTFALVAPLVITGSASADPGSAEMTSSSVSAASLAAGPPASAPCVAVVGAKACYEDANDRWWVYDSRRDGASADARWELYLDGVYLQGAICRNSRGYGKWAVCTETFLEQYRLRWQARVYDDSENDLIRTSSWVWANA